jgi:3-methyladenine DNA glycosylase/8-oxoguanine DNA glycosylase
LMEKMTNIAEQWQPYRTYACLYLWVNKWISWHIN